jgi:hypothetical protein
MDERNAGAGLRRGRGRDGGAECVLVFFVVVRCALDVVRICT